MPHQKTGKQQGRPAERGGGQQQPTEQRIPLTIEAAAKGRPVEILVVYNHHKGGLSANLRELIRHEDTAIVIPEGTGVIAGLEDTYNIISHSGGTIIEASEADADTRYYEDFLKTIRLSGKHILLMDIPASPASPSTTQTKETEQKQSANNVTEISTTSSDDVLKGFLEQIIHSTKDEDADRERKFAQQMKDREAYIANALSEHFGSGKKFARIVVVFGYMHQGLEEKLQGKFDPRKQIANLAIKGQSDDPTYKDRLWKTEGLILDIKRHGPRVNFIENREVIMRALFENIVHMFLNPDLSEEAAQQIGTRFPVKRIKNYEEAIRYHDLVRLTVDAMNPDELNAMLDARSHTPLSESLRIKLEEILTGPARRDDPVQTLYRSLL